MAARRRTARGSSRRDFKATRSPARRGLPGWVWLGGGVLGGLGLALFVFLRDPAMQGEQTSVPVALPKPEAKSKERQAPATAVAETEPQETAFSFYELLPTMFRTETMPDGEPAMRTAAAPPPEAIPAFHPAAPAADPPTPAVKAQAEPPRASTRPPAATAPRPTARPTTQQRPSRYFVQAGAFRRFGEADKLRARLALEGMESRVQTYTDAQRRTWHRVRIGPFRDRGQADRIGDRLRTGSLRPTVVKVRG